MLFQPINFKGPSTNEPCLEHIRKEKKIHAKPAVKTKRN